MNLTLIDKIKETPDVTRFVLRSDTRFKFKPGQYLLYTLPHPNPDSRKDKRYFTNSAAPFEGKTMITTRFAGDKSSSFKKALFDLAAGSSISAEEPNGKFVLENPKNPAVFIAGGIGVTPYRSIILDLDRRKVSFDIVLLYSTRNDGNIVFKKEFDSIAERNKGLKLQYIIYPQQIDKEIIKKYVPDFSKRIFYVSGPEPMVEDFEKWLPTMGIARETIKRDYFPGYNWP
jgi:ferredoxin-NADP reductase